MARGRPRKHNPAIPEHIDQAALPRGLYFADGRWYRFEPHPEGGRRKVTVAGRAARLSELHAIMEEAQGKGAPGTLGYVFDRFRESKDFKGLAASTRRDYEWCDDQVRNYPTKLGVPLGTLQVDRLLPVVFQRIVDTVAEDTPSKANHMLRYARRALSWGVRRGHCKSNPAKGVEQARERGEFKMPEHDVFTAVLRFARERGALPPHSRGSVPPYLAPAMELAYGCRMRGIEVNTLTDADKLQDGIYASRRKGSKHNVTAWNGRLRAAWAELEQIRADILQRQEARGVRRPVPIQPDQRYLIVSQSGTALRKSALDTAWQRLMQAAIEAKVITAEQRFTLHGLKHRGLTDGQDKGAAGHKTAAMQDRYNHEVPVVEPAEPREFSRQFYRRKEKGT